jgi:hypothetical protein
MFGRFSIGTCFASLVCSLLLALINFYFNKWKIFSELIVAYEVKKSLHFYETQRCSTVFTKAVIGPYSDPYGSNPQFKNFFFRKIYFNIIRPLMRKYCNSSHLFSLLKKHFLRISDVPSISLSLISSS